MADTQKRIQENEFLEMKMRNTYLNRIIEAGNNYRPKYAMPTIIHANCQGTKIHKNAPYPDENECMKRDQFADFITTKKLILTSYGDWDLSVMMVKSSNFSNRKEFDEIMLQGSRSSFGNVTPTSASSISLLEAFRRVHVKISVNTANVLASATEEQRDKYDTCFWRYGKEKTERRLLNSLLIQLFGSPSRRDSVDSIGYEAGFKELTVYDFHFYFEDGNASHGTARHSDYYLYFGFGSS